MLRRYEEARESITRAIQCNEDFGHANEPWKSWDILAQIETEAGNPFDAAEAWRRARTAYLAFRRSGGENQRGSGRLALVIGQTLTNGNPAEATSLLQQLAADANFENQLPFLTALQAIASGSRNPSIADDPTLDYTEATEVALLIESLAKAPTISSSKPSIAKPSRKPLKVFCVWLAHLLPRRINAKSKDRV